MRIYLASKRRLAVSAIVLAVGIAVLLPATALASGRHHGGPTTWSLSGAVAPATLKGGPWTLGQGPATYGDPTSGYCDATGAVTRNPGAELFQPAYFPNVVGQGRHLRGFFDYRPKDTDEAVLAARSDDGGRTWTAEGQALESNRGQCPSDALNDDGQGHPTVLHMAGKDLLYTLSRPTADSAGSQLLVHRIDAASEHPLATLPAAEPVGTGASTKLTTAVTLPAATLPAADTSKFEIPGTVRVKTSEGVVDVRCTGATATSFTGCSGGSGTAPAGATATTYAVVPADAQATTGLLSPDGILGVLPSKDDYTVTVLYVQKQKDYFTSPTQPGACNVPYATLAKIGEGKNKAPLYGNNEDLATVRTATTHDGVHFTDRGPVNGLGDNKDAGPDATRFVSPSGTVVKNPDGTYGLFYGAGNCYDGDSDGFHYIGYATSKDGVNWKIVNGFGNPLLSADTTFPQTSPGLYYSGRIYGPQVVLGKDGKSATMVFAGYRTPKPLPKPGTVLGTDPNALYTVGAGDLATYRTILTVPLTAK
ncbi:hypothetical protein [Catenulispora subtropica]|uniref:Exo-alpha-sialidase n=1 Tax=Catenulispora subtropica TaxID=450798 RepID=A0ABN2R2F3_9ACTN